MTDEKKIRCFIAADIPDIVLNRIAVYLDRLRRISTAVKWVRPQGMHITLKFLGETESERVEQVAMKLDGIGHVAAPFSMQINGSGCFPSRNRPRVFWLGLDQDKKRSLFLLHQWIEENLESLGFAREIRRFSPHLTLGRVRTAENFSSLFDFFERNPFEPEFFEIQKITLMRSHLRPGGAVYQPIKQYHLLKSR